METFLDEIKPLIIEKCKIEEGDETILLAHLDSSDNQKSEARIKTIYSLLENYCKNEKKSVENLLEEIRPSATEKCQIEFRHKSI